MVSGSAVHSYDGRISLGMNGLEHVNLNYDTIVSTCMSAVSDVPFMLGCTSGKQHANAFFTPIDGSYPRGKVWRVNNDTLASCAINGTDSTLLAFAGEKTISTASAAGQTISTLTLDPKASSDAIEWMGISTLAYGLHQRRKKLPSKDTVMLWDVRSSTATAARILRPNRITGLSKPDSSGINLIVASNYEISLYDLRLLKTDRPLLSIPHLSGGPTTYHATYSRSILAAVDKHQEVQTYSWKTGKHVKTLSSCLAESALMRNLRWYEGQHGPFLQACCMRDVLSWETGP